MQGLIIIDLNGSKYGIRKDHVLSLWNVRHVHSLPLVSPYISGISNIEGRTATLFDLGFCLGNEAFDRKSSGQVLIVSEENQLEGFVFGGDAEHLELTAEDNLLPMPGFLKSSEFEECILLDGHIVPIVNISMLYKCLRKKTPHVPPLCFPGTLKMIDLPSVSTFRTFELGGEIFALPEESINDSGMSCKEPLPLPLALSHTKGIIYEKESIYAVLNIAKVLGIEERETDNRVLLSSTGNVAFLTGLEVGIVKTAIPAMPMPAYVSSHLIDYAIPSEGELVPVINPLALAAFDKGRSSLMDCNETSEFPSLFNREDVEIREFNIYGAHHSLPAQEVKDVIDLTSYRKLPELPPVIPGIAEYKGKVVPVIDFSPYFGKRDPEKRDTKMVLIENGDLRALLLVNNIFAARSLPLVEQQNLPLSQPRPDVYGCYIDRGAIKLILNTLALLRDFDEKMTGKYFEIVTGNMRDIFNTSKSSKRSYDELADGGHKPTAQRVPWSPHKASERDAFLQKKAALAVALNANAEIHEPIPAEIETKRDYEEEKVDGIAKPSDMGLREGEEFNTPDKDEPFLNRLLTITEEDGAKAAEESFLSGEDKKIDICTGREDAPDPVLDEDSVIYIEPGVDADSAIEADEKDSLLNDLVEPDTKSDGDNQAFVDFSEEKPEQEEKKEILEEEKIPAFKNNGDIYLKEEEFASENLQPESLQEELIEVNAYAEEIAEEEPEDNNSLKRENSIINYPEEDSNETLEIDERESLKEDFPEPPIEIEQLLLSSLKSDHQRKETDSFTGSNIEEAENKPADPKGLEKEQEQTNSTELLLEEDMLVEKVEEELNSNTVNEIALEEKEALLDFTLYEKQVLEPVEETTSENLHIDEIDKSGIESLEDSDASLETPEKEEEFSEDIRNEDEILLELKDTQIEFLQYQKLDEVDVTGGEDASTKIFYEANKNISDPDDSFLNPPDEQPKIKNKKRSIYGLILLFLITVLFVVTKPAITNKGLEKTTLILNKIISEAIDVSNDVLLSIKDEEAPKVPKKENTEKIIPLKDVKLSTPEKAEDENANTSFLVMEIEPTNDKISIKRLKTLPAGYRIYKVKQGDTLWDIAKGITGNPFNYRSIAANTKIKNPDRIYPGQEIFIKII